MNNNGTDVIRALYPTTKLIACACLIVLAFVLPSFIERFILLVLIYVLVFVSKNQRNFFKISAVTLGVFFIFIMLIQSFFYPGDNPTIITEIGMFSIKYEGIIKGLNMGSSVLVFASGLLLFFQTTTIKDLIYSLEESGMNPKASYVVLATLQMIPQLYKNSQIIMNAQKARGVETEGNVFVRARAFLPVLSPLILSSIASTEEKALTLEARGFSAPGEKTQLMELNKRKIDKIVTTLIVLITFILILWRILLWLL